MVKCHRGVWMILNAWKLFKKSWQSFIFQIFSFKTMRLFLYVLPRGCGSTHFVIMFVTHRRRHRRLFKVYIFLISITFWIDLDMYVRLSFCMSVCGKHSSGRKKRGIKLKFGRNIGSSCTLVGMKNRPNREKHTPTVHLKVRTPKIFLSKNS